MTITDHPRTRQRSVADRLVRALLTPHPGTTYARSLRLPGLTRLPGFTDPNTATVVAVDRSTPDWTVLTLEAPHGFSTPPAGGAVRVGVVIDGVVHRRYYSPTDAEPASARSAGVSGDGLGPGGRPLVTLAVRRHPDGLVSNFLWNSTRPGDTILLEDGLAEMALPADRPADTLLVSGGSGLTPMLAIASTLAAERHEGRTVWLHYARTADDVPLRRRIEALAAAQGITLRIVDTSTGELIDTEAIEAVAPWHRDAEIFLCGPDGLAKGLESALGSERFADVHQERFTITEAPAGEDDGGTVTYRSSGVTAENSGTSLLLGAESDGLSPKYGCRMGICGTCTSTRISGCTRDTRTGEVSGDPDERIQICVSVPVGDVEIDL